MGFKRYRVYKMRICGKDSTPLNKCCQACDTEDYILKLELFENILYSYIFH